MKLRIFIPAIFLLFLLVQHGFSQLPETQNPAKEADLIELIKLDNTIKLDIRYATDNNFMGRTVYPEARAFLQRPAAEAVVRVHRKLKPMGLGIVIYDGYRPWTITKLFWDTVKEEHRKFVANPAKGSKHNRGCAIDLSIYDLKTGEHLDMPSGYDEFTERAAPTYIGTEVQNRNRDLLRGLMESEGFTVNSNEWWHYDYKTWQDYGIYDIAFSDVRDLKKLENLNVRRVEFSGNETVGDRDVRKHAHLHEGDIFNAENLKRSIRGINASGKFEPITEENVSWFPDEKDRSVDFLFFLKQKDREKNSIDEAEIKEDARFGKIFDAVGVTGGIYIYDLKKNRFTIYDRRRFETGFVPASTSKIFHSLIFLESGTVKDENEVIKWDGVKRWVEAWNQDHSLKTALKVSAAWFYGEASKRAGRETMQKYYDAADYGNRSTEGFGDIYWVKGDLRITPRQQIEFLVKFQQNQLPFSPKVTDMVKEMIVLEKTDKYTLRGKTGWSDAYNPQVGWLIGYVERGSDIYFFATEIDIKKNEDAPKRLEITKQVLRSMKVIE